jgi:hypothetical protein
VGSTCQIRVIEVKCGERNLRSREISKKRA